MKIRATVSIAGNAELVAKLKNFWIELMLSYRALVNLTYYVKQVNILLLQTQLKIK